MSNRKNDQKNKAEGEVAEPIDEQEVLAPYLDQVSNEAIREEGLEDDEEERIRRMETLASAKRALRDGDELPPLE